MSELRPCLLCGALIDRGAMRSNVCSGCGEALRGESRPYRVSIGQRWRSIAAEHLPDTDVEEKSNNWGE